MIANTFAVVTDSLVGLLSGGTTRADDAQWTPTQSDVSPSVLVYTGQKGCWFTELTTQLSSLQKTC